MSEPQDAGKYQVNSDGTVQGQVIGDNPTVHQHFYAPQDKATPSTKLQRVWNIPYLRNDYFTGREEILAELHTRFKANNATVLSQRTAMSGLGGIGKTQTAVEYAYRYHEEYQAVLWARAESHEALTSSFVEIVTLLDLPQKDQQDQTIIVQAAKRWLQDNTGWLLILDNADEPRIVREFLPTKCDGHILLTTRAQALGGLAQRIEVDTFTTELGALFLLRRAAIIGADGALEQVPSEDRDIAMQISEELGELPLALDQAGAYIEEAQCSLSDYLGLYRTRRAEMLKERGGLIGDHPEPVATTWSLSFQRVEEKNTAAADLLRLCAFLAPDAIPEEIITTGAEHLGPALQTAARDPLALNKAIAALGTYSLIRRDPAEKMLSIHRLVQAVLQEHIPEQEHVQWTQRIITTLNHMFHQNEDASWEMCKELVPHVLKLEEYTRSWASTPLEFAALLQRTASQISKRMQYKQAEPLYQRALQILEPVLGSHHPDLANLLKRLATHSYFLGRYEQAESFQQRVLVIKEQTLGADHPEVAQMLDSLAYLSSKQGKDKQAESLYQQAIHILERQRASNALQPLVNLGEHYQLRGNFELAETLYQQALDLWEQTTDTGNFIAVVILTNWSYIFCDRGEYQQAKHFSQRALQICEQETGPEHPDNIVLPLSSLAYVYGKLGQYEQAELLYQQALGISDRGTEEEHEEHPDIVRIVQDLANLYQEQGKYKQAEPLYHRVLRHSEQVLGFQHPETAKIRMLYDKLLQTIDRHDME